MRAVIDILDILAWPLTVLVLAFGFHPQLTALLRRVSRVGYDGFSVQFDRLIGPAERALPDEQNDDDASPRARRALRLRSLAEQAPRAAILEAWTDLAEAIETRSAPAGRNALAGAPAAESSGTDGVLHALAEIRDRALTADDHEVGRTAAIRYVNVACRARDRIESAAP